MSFIYSVVGILSILNCSIFDLKPIISITQAYISIFITICAVSFIIISHIDTTDLAYSIYYENQAKREVEIIVKNMFKGMTKKEIAKYLCSNR